MKFEAMFGGGHRGEGYARDLVCSTVQWLSAVDPFFFFVRGTGNKPRGADDPFFRSSFHR